MNKILNKFQLPIFAMVLIMIIYGGLTLRNLSNQTKNLQNQNQILNYKTVEMSSQFGNLTTQIDSEKQVIKSFQDDLVFYQNQLNIARGQILHLNSSSGTTTLSSQIATPIVATRTVTKTETKLIEKNQATVTIQNIGSFAVDLRVGDTAFTILKRASENNFRLEYEMYSFGAFIKSIGNITPTGNQYWAFYYNGKYSMVGATDQSIQKGDSIFWQLETF